MNRRRSDDPDTPVPDRRGGGLDLDNFADILEERVVQKISESGIKAKTPITLSMIVGAVAILTTLSGFGWIDMPRDRAARSDLTETIVIDAQTRRDAKQDEEIERAEGQARIAIDQARTVERMLIDVQWIVKRVETLTAELQRQLNSLEQARAHRELKQ